MCAKCRACVAAIWFLALPLYAAIGDQFGTVEISAAANAQAGRIAFIDVGQTKLVEIDLNGRVTWEYPLPWAMVAGGKLSAGVDVEWLPDSDHFLLAVPESGVFEVNRKQEIVWQYKTRFVDHDADRLPNGNTVFVFGWDGDNDPIVTEVDPAGKVVFQLFAAQLGLDPAERHGSASEKYSNTHANSVRKLADGGYLISLRNYDQFLVWKDGKVTARVTNARSVHDPVPSGDGYLFAVHLRDRSRLVQQNASGDRSPLFRPEEDTWHPLRTVEVLRNGNVLLTGSREIGQLDAQGHLVWVLRIDHFVSQKSEGKKKGSFLYKAAFVYL